jgi:hypothetical protein
MTMAGKSMASCLLPVSSIYIWSKNFSHLAYEKSEAKMAAIDVDVKIRNFGTLLAKMAEIEATVGRRSIH